MATKQKTIEVYRRYLSSLQDKNANIGECFQAFETWLRKNCEDQDLKGELEVVSLHKTLKAIKDRRINCRQESKGSWDSTAVKTCYKRVDNMEQAHDATESKELKVMTTAFHKFVNSFRSMPWMQLYMYQVYSEKEVGHWITSRQKLELLGLNVDIDKTNIEENNDTSDCEAALVPAEDQ